MTQRDSRLHVLYVLAVAASGSGCGAERKADMSQHEPMQRESEELRQDAAPRDDGGTRDGTTQSAETEWTTLIQADWAMPVQEEGYVCARLTVAEDLFISAFDAINPPGTHHTLLTVGDPSAPDGVEACTSADNYTLSVFGSGLGTNPLHFPDGVALKIEKGKQLLLNLHLFNTTLGEITGSSGTRIQVIPEAQVVELAEGVLAGTVRLNIPPQQTTTHTGYCTMQADATLFAVAPHMHQLGIYEKVVAETSSRGDVTLYDDEYDFNEQSYHRIDPLQVRQGDRVRIECTHRNTTTESVTFGESSLAEMCFAGLYRYPATGSFFICSDDFTAGLLPSMDR